MLEIFNSLRDMSMLSVCIRMLLAALCGGLIGLEREFRRRPAGFRTHILICVGAAMTTMTSQFLSLELGYATDMARIGAQVIAGIGFVGAGTIIVTRRQRVKGLTTAAGLWTAAIVGLALGAGFFEGGVLTALLVLLAERVFVRLEYYILSHSPEISLFVEYRGRPCLENMLNLFKANDVKVLNMEISRVNSGESGADCAMLFLRTSKKMPSDSLISRINATEGVLRVEEL